MLSHSYLGNESFDRFSLCLKCNVTGHMVCNVSIDISISYYLGGDDDFSELLIKKILTSKRLKIWVKEIMIGYCC